MDNIREAQELRHRYQSIIENLENNPGWQDLVKLFKEDIDNIDENWHYLNPYDANDLGKLMDSRVHKMALDKLVGALDSFKAQIEECDKLIEEFSYDS